MIRQDLGRTFADVPDAETKQHPPKLEFSAGIDFSDQVLSGFSSHSLELFNLIDGELIEIGHVVYEFFLDELIDQTLAESVDLHRSPAGPMQKRFFDFRRAGLR